ncbi:glycosyl hydrolase [Jannaschia sp. R86511]|uniref:glycosyl hydrolase n=1 Tax=Jannaschia sp. R86511 TaxID=3093853 RepID=UPI0036D40485
MSVRLRGAVATSPPTPRRSRRPARTAAAAVAAVLALSGLGVGSARADTRASDADPVPVGAGSFTTDQVGPAPEGCAPLATDARAFVTDDAPAGAVPTNDWWSSLLFKKFDCAMSEPLHAHPASFKPTPAGLGVSHTQTPTLYGTPGGIGEFHFPYAQDLLVGVEGLAAPTVEVADWSDWTVTPSWSDGTRSMTATIGHGLPFTWFELTGGDAMLQGAGDLRVWLRDDERVGFSSGGADYVAFAPTGATWATSGTTLSSDLAGEGYLSLAVLATGPGDTDTDRVAEADAFAPYAYAEVTGTRADYVYDESTSLVETVYSVQTEAHEGTAEGTVLALYPHQSAYLDGTTGDGPSAGAESERTYVSARGPMTTLVGATSFTTATPFTGVLPELPSVATAEGDANARLDVLLDAEAADPMSIDADDTYWTGKALGRAVRIAEIADQLDRTAVRDRALEQIEETLTDWFTADPGETEQVFAYNESWGTLVGFPASYGSDKELNDHHFHYGYFILAAATLARFEPDWAAQAGYGGMVDELIADANGFDRDDPRYPYLRDFDIYAGHDWASGHGAFVNGNNQESSSEGQNFANGLIQWGTATGDLETRDAGVYLYATQTAAIQQYWFDGSGAMPEGFGHSTVGMIWGSGGAYATWFSGEAEMIQGINTLPITGGHLYLGLRPDDVVSNFDEMVAVNRGEPTVWQDILWSYLALGDGDRALQALDGDREYPVEEGESRAHTFHWIANLAELGTVDAEVTADHPVAAVFSDDGARTYVAANVTQEPLTVRFSDGTSLDVPAGRTVATGAHTWSGGGAPSGTEEPGEPTEPPAPAATELYLTAAGGLSTEPGTTATATLGARVGPDAVGDPSTGLVATAHGLDGTFGGLRTSFDLGIDAEGNVGNGTRARVSYDLDGDGTWDRVESYGYFATDPTPGFERYTSAARPVESVEGTLTDMVDGSIRVEVWNVLGNGPSLLDLTGSTVRVPFGPLTPAGDGDPDPDPNPEPDPDPEPQPVVRPGAPGEVFATAVGGSRVTVTWDAPHLPGTSEVTDYRVQYRVAGTQQWQPYFDAVTATTGATLSGLEPGTAYQVRVRAVSDAGAGTFARPVQATTWSPPAAPRGLTGELRGRSVLLAWTAPVTDGGSPVTDYVVQVRPAGAERWATVGEGVGTGTTATLTGLERRSTHEVRVAAVNDVGRGGWHRSAVTTR